MIWPLYVKFENGGGGGKKYNICSWLIFAILMRMFVSLSLSLCSRNTCSASLSSHCKQRISDKTKLFNNHGYGNYNAFTEWLRPVLINA